MSVNPNDGTPVGAMPPNIQTGEKDPTSIQLAKDMRTKRYGKDVRETMARMIEWTSVLNNFLTTFYVNTSTQNSEYYRQFTDVMKELSEDKDYHSLPEIAGARRGYETLVDSMNNLSVGQINKSLGKFDGTFFTDEFIDALMNGSIDVTRLLNESVTADKISNGAITPRKLSGSNVMVGHNLYDKSDLVNGYLNGEGDMFESDQFKVAETPIKPETTISILRKGDNAYTSGTGPIQYLNANKEVIGSFVGSDFVNGTYDGYKFITVTSPPESAYIRINTVMSSYDDSDSLIITEGDQIGSGGYITKLFGLNLRDDKSRSEVENIDKSFRVVGGNLYSKSEHHRNNYYASTNGTISPANNWGLSVVPVEDFKKYSIWLEIGDYSGNIGSIIFMDNDENPIDFLYPAKPYINGTYEDVPFITVDTPENTAYIAITSKVAGQSDSSDTLILVEGDSIDSSKLQKRLISYKDAIISTNDKEYAGVKWTVVGDSLTEINSRSTKFYHEYIADELGFKVTNMGVSGTGYARTSENNTAFYQRINDIPLDTEVVTIFGSFNDLSSPLPLGTSRDTGTETIAGCINTTLDNLNTKLPLVPVGIIAPTPWHTTRPWLEGNQGTLYVELLTRICADRGLPLLNLYYTSGLRPWEESYRDLVYDKDPVGNGTHPNEIGHRLISKRVREFIKTLI